MVDIPHRLPSNSVSKELAWEVLNSPSNCIP